MHTNKTPGPSGPRAAASTSRHLGRSGAVESAPEGARRKRGTAHKKQGRLEIPRNPRRRAPLRKTATMPAVQAKRSTLWGDPGAESGGWNMGCSAPATTSAMCGRWGVRAPSNSIRTNLGSMVTVHSPCPSPFYFFFFLSHSISHQEPYREAGADTARRSGGREGPVRRRTRPAESTPAASATPVRGWRDDKHVEGMRPPGRGSGEAGRGWAAKRRGRSGRWRGEGDSARRGCPLRSDGCWHALRLLSGHSPRGDRRR